MGRTRVFRFRLPQNSQLFIVSLLMAVSLLGCTASDNTTTFAGYTYGGGGNTYSSEPAVLTNMGDSFRLQAGHPGEANHLSIVVPSSSQQMGVELQVSEGRIRVESEETEGAIESGTLIVQSRVGGLIHGSFDLEAFDGEGRSKAIVGSFSALEAELEP